MTEIVQLYRQFIELKTNPAPNDKEQVEILERIIGYLRNTDKDSMVAFMWARQAAITRRYQSEASLLRAKGIFLDMLDNLAGMLWDLNYTVKNVVYEVIFRLLKRAELSDLTLLGFDPASTAPPTQENVEFASNLRKVLLRILRDVLERVGSLGASRGADQREGHVAAPERLLFAHHLHLHVPHPLLRRRGLLAALGHAHVGWLDKGARVAAGAAHNRHRQYGHNCGHHPHFQPAAPSVYTSSHAVHPFLLRGLSF